MPNYEAKKYIPGLGKDVKVVTDEIDFSPVAVADVDTAATLADLIAAHNSLLAELRVLGIIK